MVGDALTEIRVERRHAHGMIGAVVQHPPSLIYDSQCLAEQECGDDGVSVPVRNYENFICASVFDMYQR